MAVPAVVAVHEDPAVLELVETQLVERYAQSYRVQCLADASQAARLLETLADDGSEVALLMAAPSVLEAEHGGLFDHARRLHPQAKRALLVPANAWGDPQSGGAIRAAMALGRVDHFVL